MNQLKRGFILNYINLGIGAVIPLIYTPIMLRLLGQEEYGLYKLSSSITSYLSLLSLGLGAAITRYLIKARTEIGSEEERRILGLFVLIFRVISLLAVFIGLALSINLDSWYQSSLSADNLFKMKWLVFILACNTAINFIATPYVSIVNSHERFIFLQTMAIFSTCVGPILNLISLFMGYASIGLAISSIIATVFFRFIYYIYVRRYMGIVPLFSGLSAPLIKDILVFSFWVFVSQVVGQLYDATDIVLIGLIPSLATVGVAIYSIGVTFNGIIFSLNAGFSSLLIPRANKMVFSGNSKNELSDYAIKVGRLQCFLLALFAFGFISFGKPFIHFYVGDEYLKSYWIAILMIIPNLIPLIQSFCLNILIALNKNKFRAIVYLIIAVLNVIGTWLLLQLYGILGAAFMTSISFFLGHGVIMNWYYSKVIGINIRKFWLQMCKIILCPFIMCAITLITYSYIDYYNITNLILGIIIFTIIYFWISWSFVMNSYEKGLFMTPLMKVLEIRKR